MASLLTSVTAASGAAAARSPAHNGPALTGIIDIGSNSVRLVVYEGLTRIPATLFNEKVMAGLGRGLAANGRLGKGAMDSAVTALSRFAALADAMGVEHLRTVATAAVREASNATEFIARVAAETGLVIETIDGETEARGAAFGVISGIPDANGVVGDLGGGSLELIRVANGEAHERISLPIGSLRPGSVIAGRWRRSSRKASIKSAGRRSARACRFTWSADRGGHWRRSISTNRGTRCQSFTNMPCRARRRRRWCAA